MNNELLFTLNERGNISISWREELYDGKVFHEVTIEVSRKGETYTEEMIVGEIKYIARFKMYAFVIYEDEIILPEEMRDALLVLDTLNGKEL